MIQKKIFGQNFNKGTKIHTIEIWNIDSKKYPEILSSEYFGILIPNEEQNCPIYQTPCIPERNITHVCCKSCSRSIQILMSHSILVIL